MALGCFWARTSALPALVARGRSLCGAAAQQVSWTGARFSGAMVVLPLGPIQPGLSEQLDAAMAEIRAAGRKGVWMRVPIEQSAAIPVAAEQGFRYHHAEADHAMLLNWLPPTPCPVPDFATHVIGMGGMCINARGEVLLVKELKAATATSQGNWKLPGGLVNLGEELDQAVAREVFEETGVRADFLSLLAVRHQHGAAFGRDDAYCVCLLEPRSSEITICEAEIADATWLPLGEYYEVTKAASAKQGVEENFNAYVARRVLAAAEAGQPLGSIGMAVTVKDAPRGYLPGVTGLTSKPSYRIYSGWRE